MTSMDSNEALIKAACEKISDDVPKAIIMEMVQGLLEKGYYKLQAPGAQLALELMFNEKDNTLTSRYVEASSDEVVGEGLQ